MASRSDKAYVTMNRDKLIDIIDKVDRLIEICYRMTCEQMNTLQIIRSLVDVSTVKMINLLILTFGASELIESG